MAAKRRRIEETKKQTVPAPAAAAVDIEPEPAAPAKTDALHRLWKYSVGFRLVAQFTTTQQLQVLNRLSKWHRWFARGPDAVRLPFDEHWTMRQTHDGHDLLADTALHILALFHNKTAIRAVDLHVSVWSQSIYANVGEVLAFLTGDRLRTFRMIIDQKEGPSDAENLGLVLQQTLPAFFERCPSLTELRIDRGHFMTEDVWLPIVAHNRSLTRVDVSAFVGRAAVAALSGWCQLPHLQSISIHCDECDVEHLQTMLADAISLQTLQLVVEDLPDRDFNDEVAFDRKKTAALARSLPASLTDLELSDNYCSDGSWLDMDAFVANGARLRGLQKLDLGYHPGLQLHVLVDALRQWPELRTLDLVSDWDFDTTLEHTLDLAPRLEKLNAPYNNSIRRNVTPLLLKWLHNHPVCVFDKFELPQITAEELKDERLVRFLVDGRVYVDRIVFAPDEWKLASMSRGGRRIHASLKCTSGSNNPSTPRKKLLERQRQQQQTQPAQQRQHKLWVRGDDPFWTTLQDDYVAAEWEVGGDNVRFELDARAWASITKALASDADGRLDRCGVVFRASALDVDWAALMTFCGTHPYRRVQLEGRMNVTAGEAVVMLEQRRRFPSFQRLVLTGLFDERVAEVIRASSVLVHDDGRRTKVSINATDTTIVLEAASAPE